MEALKHIRYQRIAEVFLVQVMGINWLQVYEEALRLSDGLSDAIIERMFSMTGEPAFCPHGEPIPSAEGKVIALQDAFLSQAEAGNTVRISRLITREG